MRPVASGRPGTQVIPAGWAAAHRTPVAGTWTAECSIRRPGGTRGPFNPATGTYASTDHAPHHTGPCRVQVLGTAEQERLAAEQDITGVGYLVAVEYDAGTAETPIQVDDLVTITAVDDNGSPTLVGRELPVVSIARGSLVFELDLTCVDYLNPQGAS